MAGSQASERRHRPHRESEGRQQQLIFIGAGAVLAIILILVVVGLVLTWYLPPRAHVMTIGSRDYNAAEVADRAYYLATAGNGNAQSQPAEEATRALIRQQILMEIAAPTVPEVTDEDVRAGIAEQLNLPEGFTDEEYAENLAAYLRVAPIDQDDLRDIVRAGIVEDRLLERLRSELPASGDQLHLQAVVTDDRNLGQQLVDAVRGGEAFETAAVRLGLVQASDEIVDVGWYAPSSLDERVSEALVGLQQGEISDLLDDERRIGFQIFFVDQRSTDEPYEEAVLDQLQTRAFNDYMDEQEASISVEMDLSGSESDWIRDRVIDRLVDGA